MCVKVTKVGQGNLKLLLCIYQANMKSIYITSRRCKRNFAQFPKLGVTLHPYILKTISHTKKSPQR